MENAMQPPLPPPPPPACDMPQSSSTEQTVTHELTFGTSNLSMRHIFKGPRFYLSHIIDRDRCDFAELANLAFDR
ncbi:hypothetical protein ACS0PU_007784 [Formica fusca]